MANGTKIKTIYGEWLTVMKVVYNVVYVYEFQGTVHISNIVQIK